MAEKDPALVPVPFLILFVTSTGEVQPCEATEISFGNIQDEDFLEIYARACKAFPKPATGCIPMVMYPEVRDYQKVKAQLSSPEKSELSTKIMQGFQEKGSIPGVYGRYGRRMTAPRVPPSPALRLGARRH
jgi:hypothetical protein